MKKILLISLYIFTFMTSACEQVTIMEKFSVPSMGPLAFDGEHFWIFYKQLFYKTNLSGETIDYLEIPLDIRGITFDGESFWAAEPFDIYKLDKEWNILSSFRLPDLFQAEDVAFDGTHLLIANRRDGKIYRFNTDGEQISSFWLPEKIIPRKIECNNGYLWFSEVVNIGSTQYWKIFRAELDGTIIETFIVPERGIYIRAFAFGNDRIWFSGAVNKNEIGMPFLFKTTIKMDIGKDARL